MDKLQTKFNEVSAHCADLNAQLNAKLLDDTATPEDVKKIKEYNLEDVFILHKTVSYDKSVEVMKESDILVLFDTLMSDKPVQPYLPSKIVEYLLLRKPILGICDKNSPSYRILKEHGFNEVGSDVESIKLNIKRLIEGVSIEEYSIADLNSDMYNMLEL